jgi:hypothetical protein
LTITVFEDSLPNSRGPSVLADEIKSGSSSAIGALMFAPAFLAAEFLGNIFPGLLFYFLLFLKKNSLAYSLFQAPFIGYRTKLLIVIFLSFVIGKLLGTPYAMLQAGVFPGNSPIQLERTKHSKEQQLLINIAIGAIVMPTLIGKSGIIDYLVLGNAGVYFSFSSGLALLIASAIPGDGQTLRIIELVVGLLFLVSGYIQAKHFMTAVMAFVGMSLKKFIEKIPAQYLPALMPAFALLSKLINEEASLPKPDQPKVQPTIAPGNEPTPSA